MQEALSLFESVLPLDHKDTLMATVMLLQSLVSVVHVVNVGRDTPLTSGVVCIVL